MKQHLEFLWVFFIILAVTTIVFFIGYFSTWFIDLNAPEINPLLWSVKGRFTLVSTIFIEFAIAFWYTYLT